MKLRKRSPIEFLLPGSIAIGLVLALTSVTTAQQAASGTFTTRGGLHSFSFDVSQGRVIVYLPDDMAAGDTISGTIIAEPSGQTVEERSRNRDELNIHSVKVQGNAIPVKTGQFQIMIPATSSSSNRGQPSVSVSLQDQSGKPIDLIFAGGLPSPRVELVGRNEVRYFVQAATRDTDAPGQEPQSHIQKQPISNFKLPDMGQQGRLVQITGPFDGVASNTTINFRAIGGAQGSEKKPENVPSGFGLIRPLAESPRKSVFEAPRNFTGPVELILSEGNLETKGQYRNIGVRLTAPKTNLLRDEQTTLTVQVHGLEGIKQEVPLQLDSKGVITMDGGNFQNLKISPSEVSRDGIYTATRGITGQQQGSFNVTATVIVRPFDVCIQDDSIPARVIVWNTFTGDYIFNCIGCLPPKDPKGNIGSAGTSGQAGGTTQATPTKVPLEVAPPTVTWSPTSVSRSMLEIPGTGSVAIKGCIITLQHNAPDRRVMSRLDTCSNTGEASVQTNSSKTTFTITDKNTADNSCPAN